ncbi:hypothetical protein A8U91_03355 [Halomonas elongata]|uniref:Beta-lactamase n=1 Tax=Halomonas elongata TaxID=2746 RepID=A0A1B8NWD4_HALEL|nr:hypothetical protein [Halomonas elongata]OBX34302.1 hypothetical protein A8U91_03355 [Halomonas elongata]
MRLSRAFLSRLALAMVLSVPIAGPALADAEKLEADLRALFADQPGELTIGDVSESLLGGETRAEGLEYVSDRASGCMSIAMSSKGITTIPTEWFWRG